MDAEILTTLLRAYMDVFTLGIGRLVGDARWLLFMLLVIDIALLGMWITLGASKNIAAALIEIGMKTSIYLFLLNNWSFLTRALIRGFIHYGLVGGGETISEADLSDPSMLASYGISAMAPVMNKLLAYRGWDVLFNLHDIFFSGLAAMGGIVAFFVFGIQVFVALLQFYGTATATVVMIPWGMLRQTSFVAEKAFAGLWAFALKLLILSLIASVGLTVMRADTIRPGLNPDFWQCVVFALSGWVMVVLAIVGPKWALNLLHGTPQLSAHDVTSAAQSTASVVSRLVSTIRSVSPSGGRPPTRRPI